MSGKVVHVKKFGASTGMTPQEMHAKYAWRGKCQECGGPPAVRIKVLAPLRELMSRAPHVIAALAAANPDPQRRGHLPVIPTVHGPMLMTSDVYACRFHAPAAEAAAAHGPSWAIVEIDRGPDPTNRVVSGWAGDPA